MGSGWSSEEERQPLLGPGPGPAPGAAWRSREVAAAALPAAAPGPGRVYGRRWLVLLLFSLLGFAQGLVWNTWGPIQNSACLAYGFSSWDIALLVLWGPIGFLPCFAFMWLLDKRGEGLRGTPARAGIPGGCGGELGWGGLLLGFVLEVVRGDGSDAGIPFLSRNPLGPKQQLREDIFAAIIIIVLLLLF